jgi:rod shape-determining protein MreD
MTKFFLPFIMVVLFVLESFLADEIIYFISDDHILVPRFLLVALVMITAYIGQQYAIMYGLVFGLLYDLVYTEIIGVYTFAYPVIVYIMSKTMKILQNNILIVSILCLFSIVIVEFFVYGINLLIGVTDMDLHSFLNVRLYPTLILNGVFVIIFAYPLKRLTTQFALEKKEE